MLTVWFYALSDINVHQKNRWSEVSVDFDTKINTAVT